MGVLLFALSHYWSSISTRGRHEHRPSRTRGTGSTGLLAHPCRRQRIAGGAVFEVGQVEQTFVAEGPGVIPLAITGGRRVGITTIGNGAVGVVPGIFAAGEMAQWRGEMWGITAAAEHQAEIIAKYIAGDWASYYQGSLSMNIMKIQGVQLCSLGMIDAPTNNPEYEEIIFIDKAKRYYKKCIVHRDKLVGAILIGDKSEFLEFKDLIGNKIELSDKRMELLRSGKKADPVMGKLVCSCNNVGEGNLKNAIAGGCKDFTQLCSQTGAGTGCGSCRPEVKAILESLSKKEDALAEK